MADLVSKLESPEHINLPSISGGSCYFPYEELLVYLLVKLVHRLPHAIAGEFMFGGNSSR